MACAACSTVAGADQVGHRRRAWRPGTSAIVRRRVITALKGRFCSGYIASSRSFRLSLDRRLGGAERSGEPRPPTNPTDACAQYEKPVFWSANSVSCCSRQSAE